MNERIQRLRAKLFDVKPGICPERARYFTQSMKETEGEYIALRRAKGFANVLKNMTVIVNDDELITGNQASSIKAAPIFPEYSTKWIYEEFDGNPYYMDQRPGDRFYFTQEIQDEILDILDYWRSRSLSENFQESLPEDCKKAWEIGVAENLWVSNAGLGNVIVDFDRVLKYGLNDVIRRAQEKHDSLSLSDAENVKKRWYLQSMIIANKAVIDFANRIADECEVQANKLPDGQRKNELIVMAKNLRNVPANGAESFWEAVQCVWIILLVEHLETNGHAISLGRFDQYIDPFLQKDLSAGKITKEEALEIIESFYIKVNELNKLRSWPDSEFYLGYQMFVNLSIAGQTIDDKDAVNDTTYLCVDACRELQLISPSVSVKYSDYNSPEFVDYVLQAVQEHKGGQPAFYNDKSFIRILEQMGVKREDAINWANVGCIESSIPGKWDYAAKGPTMNPAKMLEMVLHGGKDPKTGITLVETKPFEEMESMDEVVEACEKQLLYIMQLQQIMENINDTYHIMLDLNPFRSSLVDDCIDRAKDMIEGGTVYSAEGGPIAGINTTADSLAAIDWAVFTEKILTPKQMLHALDTNFEDQTTTPTGEEIRAILANRAPKFGNDNDAADKWAYWIENFLGSHYQTNMKSSRYGKGPIPAAYSLSLSPVTSNVPCGMIIGATPNGRRAGEALNNGISPCNGCETCGPTAAIKSVGKMPSQWFQKGAIFNMRLERWALLERKERDRVAALIKTLFDSYGVHVQFNVIDNETLLKAQKDPEKYKDLMVRISGYSALFAPLSTDIQNDLIGREVFNLD